ncbi:MAG: hypothetical protein C0618_10960 [Desulfuromonas sp.]|nr:MAG: hypothetical protein C0618_10960 [Desulfuromonas sp.]
MDALSPRQCAELRADLVTLIDQLRDLLAASESGCRPVGLDQPIGRLSRMDALQQQQMAQATRQKHELRLGLAQQALTLLERGTYGDCRRCEEPVGYARLKARPETPFCLECQSEREGKN